MEVKQTAMQELRSDLLLTIDTSHKALEEINDSKIRESCQTVVKKTIDAILSRIDSELLKMEQIQKETEYVRGFQDGKQYYIEEYGNKRN